MTDKPARKRIGLYPNLEKEGSREITVAILDWLSAEGHSGYLPSPQGYDAAHRVRGIDIPENLMWQQHQVNVMHYWDARRQGLPWRMG
jgi:hypothetical protein